MKKFVVAVLTGILLAIILYAPLRNAFLKLPPKPTSWLGSTLPSYRLDTFGAPIQAGFSKAKITPPKLVWMGGRYPCRPALIVNDDLWVKALALKDKKGETIVFVSVDIIGLLPDEIQKILQSVKIINPERIFISATHTHAGPDTLGLWGPGIGRVPLKTGRNEEYLKFLRQQVHRAIFEAVSNLNQAAIRFSRGALPGYIADRPNNPADHSFSVIQVAIQDPDNEYRRLPVTLVNAGAHPDMLNSVYISQDFPYYLEKSLKILLNCETMFIPRAIGGMELEDAKGKRPVSLMKKFGEDLAMGVFVSLRYPITPKRAAITVKTLEIKSLIENKNFLQAAKAGVISDTFIDENNMVTAPISLVTVGPAAIIAVPGELFPNIWQRVEPLMGGRPNFCFGLTSGELGYILSPEDFNSGLHPYHVTMSLGPSFGRQIQETLEQLISKKYKNKKRSF